MTKVSFQNLQVLAVSVNEWCEEREILPASGQAAESLSERNIRYYRTLGLLDGPLAGGGYGRRHFLQLASIRVLQARGLPLKRIQELLYGRDDEGLEELLERAASEAVPAPPAFPAFSNETWNVSALGGPFALLSRGGARPTPAQLAAISEILNNNTVTK
jgi:DNA-binding transcriptional MerR regulator